MAEKHLKKHKATYLTVIPIGTILTVATPIAVQHFDKVEEKVDHLLQNVMTREEIAGAINNAVDIYSKVSPSREEIKQAIKDLRALKNKTDVDIALVEQHIKMLEQRIMALEIGGG